MAEQLTPTPVPNSTSTPPANNDTYHITPSTTVVVPGLSDPVKMAVISGVFAFLSAALVALPVVISARSSAEQAREDSRIVARTIQETTEKTAGTLEEIRVDVNSNMTAQIAHVKRLEEEIKHLREELLLAAKATPP